MAMTPDQTSLIKEIAAGAALFLITFMQQYNARKAKKERKANLAVVEKVHTLVNSQMGSTLNVARLATKRTAEVTGHPSDVAVAQEAERAYQEHQKKQAEVDATTISKGPGD
jgi:hypothetical protein